MMTSERGPTLSPTPAPLLIVFCALNREPLFCRVQREAAFEILFNSYAENQDSFELLTCMRYRYDRGQMHAQLEQFDRMQKEHLYGTDRQDAATTTRCSDIDIDRERGGAVESADGRLGERDRERGCTLGGHKGQRRCEKQKTSAIDARILTDDARKNRNEWTIHGRKERYAKREIEKQLTREDNVMARGRSDAKKEGWPTTEGTVGRERRERGIANSMLVRRACLRLDHDGEQAVSAVVVCGRVVVERAALRRHPVSHTHHIAHLQGCGPHESEVVIAPGDGGIGGRRSADHDGIVGGHAGASQSDGSLPIYKTHRRQTQREGTQ